LNSFLARHIDRLVKNDEIMKERKSDFKEEVKKATDKVLK
jgi:hypothetical protein